MSSVAGLVVLHLVRRDLSPVGDRLSEYANGDHGAIMTLAFIALGSGMIVLGVAMAASGEVSGWSRVIPLTVMAAGGGMIISGLYPTDPTGEPTTTEAIHSLASGFASLAVIGAAVAWSILRWGRRPPPPLGLSAALAGSAVVLGAVSPVLHDTRWTGLSQRLLWLTLLAWLLLTTWHLDAQPSVAPVS